MKVASDARSIPSTLHKTFDRPAAERPLTHVQDAINGLVVRGRPALDAAAPATCGDIGLAITTDGTWLYQGSPIRRKPLVALFASVLRRDDDDRYYLVTPVEKVPVSVADVPFLAVDMHVSGEGSGQALRFTTQLGDAVTADDDHPLRFTLDPETGGLKPYVLVRGRLEARLTRSLAFELAERLVSASMGGKSYLGVWSGGCFFAAAAPDTQAAS